jgi:hypothetical protein
MSEEEKIKNLWLEIPTHAWISLARRGMEKIKLDQCFLPDCENQDIKLLEPFDMEENDDAVRNIKTISIKCHKCNGIFKLKLETLKKVARPTKRDKDKEDEGVLSMGLVYALDKEGKNIGHIGYF